MSTICVVFEITIFFYYTNRVNSTEIVKSQQRSSWIDVAKFLAICLIVLWHCPNNSIGTLCRSTTLWSNVPFFFLISGYFTKVDITFERAFKRVISLSIPFLLWNYVISWTVGDVDLLSWKQFMARLVGYQYLFVDGFDPLGIKVHIGQPFATATWFLRDLILVSLLSPLVKYIKLPLVIFVLIYFSLNISTSINATLNASSVTWFGLGMLLSGQDIERVKVFFEENYRMCLIYFSAIMLLSLCLGFNQLFAEIQKHPDWPIWEKLSNFHLFKYDWKIINIGHIATFQGIFFILFLGYSFDRYLNYKNILSLIAPSSYLIYVLHYPIILLTPASFWKASISNTLLSSTGIVIGIIFFYLLVKRFLPALLPYIANERIKK